MVNPTMKTNFRKISISILVMLLAVSFLLPVLSMAKSDNAGGKNKGVFCSRIENWIERVDQNLAKNQERLTNRQEERLQNLEKRRLQREEKLAEHREKWEQNREEQYTKLEEKAQTDAQKQAVLEFKQAVEAAISARKTAVDAAISTFRTGLDQLINNRKTATENARNAYRNAYQVAVQKAKDDCAAGVDANQIRTTFMAELKAGKDKYNSDRQAIEKISTKTLVETRQDAFKKALNDFKAAIQAAKDELRAAFPTTEE